VVIKLPAVNFHRSPSHKLVDERVTYRPTISTDRPTPVSRQQHVSHQRWVFCPVSALLFTLPNFRYRTATQLRTLHWKEPSLSNVENCRSKDFDYIIKYTSEPAKLALDADLWRTRCPWRRPPPPPRRMYEQFLQMATRPGEQTNRTNARTMCRSMTSWTAGRRTEIADSGVYIYTRCTCDWKGNCCRWCAFIRNRCRVKLLL